MNYNSNDCMERHTWTGEARPAVLGTGHPGATAKLPVPWSWSVKRRHNENKNMDWRHGPFESKPSYKLFFYLWFSKTARVPKNLFSSVSGLRFLINWQRKCHSYLNRVNYNVDQLRKYIARELNSVLLSLLFMSVAVCSRF